MSNPFDASDLLGSREIRFISREESNYPILMRLCMDFDFRVLQLQRRLDTDRAEQALSEAQGFVLVPEDYRTSATTITSEQETLEKLEDYVKQHQVDILHDYLFGGSEDDQQDDIAATGRD